MSAANSGYSSLDSPVVVFLKFHQKLEENLAEKVKDVNTYNKYIILPNMCICICVQSLLLPVALSKGEIQSKFQWKGLKYKKSCKKAPD